MFQICGVNSLAQAAKVKEYDPNIVVVPSAFIPTMNDIRPIQLIYGSRFSGKSYSKAIELLYKCCTLPYFRAVFVRSTATAARQSQFQLFKDILTKYPLIKKEFNIHETSMMITCIETGNYIKGASFEHPDSIMSVPDLTYCWCEEAISWNSRISRQDFQTIQGTLRGKNNEPTMFSFTFNPINKKNFIYEDFFDQQKKKYNESEVGIFRINYNDNPFCPDSSKVFLDTLKRTNPERYLVDGMGEFGEEQNDAPFFYHYENIKHTPLEIIDGEKLDSSFDFNFNPVTIVFGQKINGVGLFIYDCFSIDGGTENACLKTKHIVDRHVGGLRVTGDFSGNQRSASSGIIGGQEVTDYLKIQKTWDIGNNSFYNTKTVNPLLHKSRELCNSVFYHLPVYFADNQNCKDLYDEIQKAKSTESNDGKIGLYKNRELGYGMDRVDSFRYLLNLWFPDDERDVLKFKNSL
jgi:hypothetical protein